MGGQQLGHGLADVTDAERDEQSREARLAGAVQRGDQVRRRLLPHALERHQLLLLQGEDVGEARDETGIDELVDQLLAESVDVQAPRWRDA